MAIPASERHLKNQYDELLARYDILTRRIAALDTDIGRELDSERRLVLKERRADLVAERDQILDEMTAIELRRGSKAPAAPEVIGTDPLNGATNVPRDLMTIRIQFDRPMDAGGCSLSQRSGFGLGKAVVAYDVASHTFSVTRDNPGLLPANTTFTFTVNPPEEPGPGFVDLEGISAQTVRFSLTTGSRPTDEEWAAAQERASLQRQLAELCENLRLIEERKSEYVLATDVPLTLIKEHNRTLQQIKNLEDQLSQIK